LYIFLSAYFGFINTSNMRNFPSNFLAMAGIVALVIVIFSFNINKISASDKSSTDESRLVAPFNEIEVSGGFEIKINQGTQTPVKITGSEDDIKHIKTEVKDNTLKIGIDNNGNKNYNIGKVIIEITVPELYEIEAAGSSTIKCNGTFGGAKDMEFSISGSGTIAIDVNADELDAKIAGSGEMMFSGKANEVDFTISGSGNFKGENLIANSAEISISGSGNAYLTAQNTLEVNISGSGSVYYGGSPKVNSSISGSGKVQAK
ncbi:MAG TPA: head GIN domain-containing protein, partial [Chitinophagales bacterium]|nr:head GIN domain-containing protein [Chitinophagales bacterium]